MKKCSNFAYFLFILALLIPSQGKANIQEEYRQNNYYNQKTKCDKQRSSYKFNVALDPKKFKIWESYCIDQGIAVYKFNWCLDRRNKCLGDDKMVLKYDEKEVIFIGNLNTELKSRFGQRISSLAIEEDGLVKYIKYLESGKVSRYLIGVRVNDLVDSYNPYKHRILSVIDMEF
tara:strand:+ start:423 stop:944 length:522 start_codon:yes stop_codon:yes gene_type:complete